MAAISFCWCQGFGYRELGIKGYSGYRFLGGILKGTKNLCLKFFGSYNP